MLKETFDLYFKGEISYNELLEYIETNADTNEDCLKVKTIIGLVNDYYQGDNVYALVA